MITVATQTIPKEKGLLALLLLIGATGGIVAFTPSYLSNFNVLTGSCLLPFTLIITGSKRNNVFYAGVMILFAALAVTYKIRICYFLALAFYFLWLFEFFAGRSNVLILFLILFMSPFFIQVVVIVGFPLRLMLSECAGAILKLIGVNVQVQGNMMTLDGHVFNVDEACMGLNMLVISLLMGVFVLAYRYRVSNTTLGFYSTTIFFGGAFILNMVTNVMRIIILVLFRIPPENPMHDFIGLLCLVVYVVLPLHLLSAWFVRKYGETATDSASQPILCGFNIMSIVILPVIVVFAGATLRHNGHSSRAYADVHFGNIKPERLNDGISKISTNELLIYVKTIPEFFTGEHTPLMCWKGSGYEFSGIATTTIEGTTIYKGKLIKDGKTLHTAWWYSNGHVATISQLDWRFRMLKGEPKFCLVNVTAQNEQTLMNSIKSMFSTDLFRIKTSQ